MGKKLIDFIDITKSYNGNVVLDDLNLYIRENEFLTLLGPSGCGKTTTLRMLGGFETPDKGKIMFDSKDITNMPANERNLNTVFQKYSLFPHMTIAENIAFGLKIKKKSKAYIDDKIKYALKLVNLDGFENRSVDSLSGGQQQRIAIARAIVNEPKVLLLDEPLGALDLKLRQSMQYELIRLKNELGITFVYVTHDQEEALTMSDTIVVMNQGYIQQIGTPEDIYNEPENAFVADFIGHSNIIDSIMIKDKLVEILGVKMPCVDVVIPVLHGLWGEDGTVQGLLELAGIPYVGCGVLASAVCMDKAVANAMFDASGIPHTKWLSATRWEIESDPDGVCDGVIAKLGWPIFVKPANAGSSVGITKAHDRDELKAAIRLALANDRKVVFEAFVDGHEVECAVIGSDPAVSTRPGEILAGAEFYTYDDKYKNGVSQVVIPAKLPEEKLDEVKTYAAMAYTALGCEGLARCDFFVEKDTGRVLINEINTLPGFTPISMYPKLMEHEGIPVPALIDRLIALALERTEKQHG